MEKSDDPLMQPVTQRYPDHHVLVKVAFVTAIATSIGGAASKVWDMFYTNFKDRGPIAELREVHKQKMSDLLVKAEKNPMERKEFVKAMAAEETRFGKAFNAFIKKSVGIESEGLGAITGTWHRFDALGPYTKAKIAFGTVFTTAAAIAGYELVNQNANMKRDMISMQERLEQERRQVPALPVRR